MVMRSNPPELITPVNIKSALKGAELGKVPKVTPNFNCTVPYSGTKAGGPNSPNAGFAGCCDTFLPTPPTEPKQGQDAPRRPFSVRPKSSDSTRRSDVNTGKSSVDNQNKIDPTKRQRPKRYSKINYFNIGLGYKF